MKRTLLLSSIFGVFSILVFNSNASGPAHSGNGNRTGGPGSSGNTCASGGCHSAASGTVSVQVALRKQSDNTPVTDDKYVPGTTYVVTLTGNHASLTKFGFQIMAVKSTSPNANAGTWGVTSDYNNMSVGGRAIVEHHHVLSKTGTEFKAEFNWIAPSSDVTTSVTFHAIINAVNGDGTVSGDAVGDPYSKTFTANTTSVADMGKNENIRLYPNPVTNLLHISFADVTPGNYTASVYDLTGKVIINRQINVNTNTTFDIPADGISNGLYHLVISNGSQKHTIPFVKQ